METLALFGLLVGMISGFFGVGGGAILVPLLMLTGLTIKEAVGVSIVQMLFSSLFGSALNYKNKQLEVKIILFVAIGGFIGAFASAYWVPYVSNEALECLFFFFALAATVKLFISTPTPETMKVPSKWVLILFGMVTGTLSISVGVGGAIILTPFLVSYIGVPIKTAINSALFFVVFSSIAAFTSWSLEGTLLLKEGLIVGVGSLLGVYVSIIIGAKVSSKWHKRLLILLNIGILMMISYRIFL